VLAFNVDLPLAALVAVVDLQHRRIAHEVPEMMELLVRGMRSGDRVGLCHTATIYG